MTFRLEHVFYSVGGLFSAAAVIYFAWEYLVTFPRVIKATLLFLLIPLFFLLGKICEWRDV